MFYYIDDTCFPVYNAEQVVLAAKQNYGVDLIWDQPKDKIVTDGVDTSHMVYSSECDELYWQKEEKEVILFFTDIFRTADGSPLPEALIEDIRDVYEGDDVSVSGNTISVEVDCR